MKPDVALKMADQSAENNSTPPATCTSVDVTPPSGAAPATSDDLGDVNDATATATEVTTTKASMATGEPAVTDCIPHVVGPVANMSRKGGKSIAHAAIDQAMKDCIAHAAMDPAMKDCMAHAVTVEVVEQMAHLEQDHEQHLQQAVSETDSGYEGMPNGSSEHSVTPVASASAKASGGGAGDCPVVTNGGGVGLQEQAAPAMNLNYVPVVSPSGVPNHSVPNHLNNGHGNGTAGSRPAAGPAPQNRAHSPARNSPNSGTHPHSPRDSSPHNTTPTPATSANQHVVHVHVNLGETFSVRVGDQIQYIPGPATVRMVSNNGPPTPMPMQVPPGHMVQQIVDENGILTHVILSPQPPGMAGPPMTGGPNGTPQQQMYPPYPTQYAPYPTQYAPHHHPHQAPHLHPMAAPHVHGTPPPPQPQHQCNSHTHSHIHATGPPTHHSHSPADDRTQRQKNRLQEKLRSRYREGYYNHIPVSPGRRNMNGDIRHGEPNSGSSSSVDGQELEEEQRVIRQLLSKMSQPKVSEIEARSALIQLIAPEFNQQEFEILPNEFKYELQLCERRDTSERRDSKYKTVYSGDATEITLKDLKPATEYHLKVSAMLDDLKGDATEAVSFKTLSCEPDPPQQPKLMDKKKTSLLLRWNAPADNGAKVSTYALEYDQGRGDRDFEEIYSGPNKQFKVTKLNTSTGYAFRLAACNSVGKSDFSDIACYYTSGTVPSQPDPPMCSEKFVKALTISWIKRPNDDKFTLQMEDEATGHGFLSVYNGPELSYKIINLRRNTDYKFRLQASNDEGGSKWSDIVCYRTHPDRPGPPSKLQLKGKPQTKSFRVTWDPPKDTGGTEITSYLVEVDAGRGYVLCYNGAEREFACDGLLSGSTYLVHVACTSKGGQSEWCDALTVQTQAVCPCTCQPPKLQGKPKATSLHLKWAYPEYDGGATVSDYEVLMTNPDNTTREVYRGRDVECLVAGLLPGRPYLFQVRALNRIGAGPWSDILEVVSGAGVPDPPKLSSLTCRSPYSAVVSWDEPVNNGARICEYRLEWQPQHDSATATASAAASSSSSSAAVVAAVAAPAAAEFTQLYCGPALSFEVKSGLNPATAYGFRVQAMNSAGAGPFSAIATVVTPASSPGQVMSVRASRTATTVQLTWKAPQDNGSSITGYNINIGDRLLNLVDNVLEHVMDDLVPETTYRLRVQGVNEIGVGAFSASLKVTTLSLPPNPPHLECVSCGPNSLKLKWGDGRRPELEYCLEMLRDNGSYHPIYFGASLSHKVNKLPELTDCQFRIFAKNEAGNGPYSDVFMCRTTKAPPPAVKAPKVYECNLTGGTVEWSGLKAMGRDTLVYVLHLRGLVGGREQEGKEIYRGTSTSHRVDNLQAKSEYQVRVCAIRQSTEDASGDLTGAFSPWVSFSTLSPQPAPSAATASAADPAAKLSERRQLSDQQWAAIILLCFALCAVVIAFLAQQIIAYTSSSGGSTSSLPSSSSSSPAAAAASASSSPTGSLNPDTHTR